MLDIQNIFNQVCQEGELDKMMKQLDEQIEKLEYYESEFQ